MTAHLPREGRGGRAGFWIGTLFAAEQVPAAIVTYVSVLMFLQTGAQPAMATFYCGLLFLPWVLKSFLRAKVLRMGHFRRQLQWLELCMVAVLMALAFAFLRYTHRSLFLFVGLFMLSMLTAWHELAARMYYERSLRPREQRVFNVPKTVASQSAVVLTYGAMIMFVGALQVIYRNIPRSWNEGCYLMSGLLLVFAIIHVFALHRTSVPDPRQHSSAIDAVRREIRIIDRISQRPGWYRVPLMLFMLLLPQSLMFYSRVLFLYMPQSLGGLGCTIQEIGFAQGTIGVVAFSLGLLLGRNFASALGGGWGRFLLGLSPVVYLMMSLWPPESLPLLCLATFFAQFLFGLGLPVVMQYVREISGERYRNTINYLYIPLVATVMLLPMALSGWMVSAMGFRTFFLIDVLTAPVAWLCLYFFDRRSELQT